MQSHTQNINYKQSTDFSNPHLRSLKLMLDLITDMKNESLIDDKQFNTLSAIAYSIYAENQIEDRLENQIEDKLENKVNQMLKRVLGDIWRSV